jgi:molecular chaperone GrpE
MRHANQHRAQRLGDEHPAGPEGGSDEGAEAAGPAGEIGPGVVEGAGGPEAPAAAAGGPAAAAELYKDRWLRTEADFQTFRRRAQRETEEARRQAEEHVMMEMIHALDDLERALGTAPEAGAPEAWAEGVRLVANRMNEYLGRHGVSVMDPAGEPFDPRHHEAILEVDAPGAAPGEVVQVVLRGYRRGDHVLRPARVVVARTN